MFDFMFIRVDIFFSTPDTDDQRAIIKRASDFETRRLPLNIIGCNMKT